MKKGFKALGVAALVTGVVMASATFFGCKDNDENFTALVTGDFKTQATAEDITAVNTVLAKSGDQIFGDTTKENFTTNLRLLVNGTVDMKMSVEQDGNSMSMQRGTGYDVDHILTFDKKDGALNMRGSGSYSASISKKNTTKGGQTANSETTWNMSGTSYSDNENAYINGKAQIKVSNPMNAESNVNFNQSVKVTQSFYDAFNMFYKYNSDGNILGSLVDKYTIEYLLEYSAVADSGISVYVDKTSTADHTKIKISMNEEFFFQTIEDMFSDEMLGQLGITDVEQYLEKVKEAFKFSFYDIYLEYANSTNTLVAYGEQAKASVNLPKDESGVSLSLTINQNQWVGYTDKQAKELPTDLDSYNTEMPSIGM